MKEASIGDSSLNWQQCFRENATYLGCPIDQLDLASTFYVAVHNPASTKISTVSLQVPAGTYSVQSFNKEESAFEDTDSTLLCDDVKLDGHPRVIEEDPEEIIIVNNCELFASLALDPNEVGYLLVTIETLEKVDP
mmetsp:Transcript_30443/g.29835  ORF Transcript_30443/g.29835 Transcript_30443/m.29835 type:complete len:136 (+) Transcript_30443:1350-1757(+)